MGRGRKAERKPFSTPFSTLLQESEDVVSGGLITMGLPSEHFCCKAVFRWEIAEREWEAADVGFSQKKESGVGK